MFHNRSCGCKGQRTCLVCEERHGDVARYVSSTSWITDQDKENAYVYCPDCDLAWPGWDILKDHPNHSGQSIRFPGVKVVNGFITEQEEEELLAHIDEVPWDPSQSGRRKQNYGPKCNFKKKRVRTENFSGYPAFTKFIQDRFSTVNVLSNFHTVEQCSLDYPAETGASIDPHIDDCWIWGERIPTLSLLLDSVLTLRKYDGPISKYNLPDTQTYPTVMDNDRVKSEVQLAKEYKECSLKNSSEDTEPINSRVNGSAESDAKPKIVRLPMPRRSLLVFYGSPRYEWEHGILREDIASRRVCITYRELTPTYLPFGSKADIGAEILKAGKVFWNHYQQYGIESLG